MPRKFQWPLCFAAVVLGAGAVFAQDSKALIDALVRKGILTNDEAAALATEVRDAPKAPANATVATSGSKYLKELRLGGRFQVQYVGLNTEVEGASGQPSATDHFFLRRIYLGACAHLSDGWSATLTYDFAGSTFDTALVSWKWNELLTVDAGLKKVAFLWDEYSSSSDIRAIERSPLARYFADTNNGRRLGAGSYHVGLFAGGNLPWGFFYDVAVTNPERDETFSGVTSVGNRANNRQAFWGNLGLANTLLGVHYRLGVSGGYLPDQGGRAVGVGDNLAVYGAYLELARGGFLLRGEYAGSQNEHGASATVDSKGWGYYVMPCYRIGNVEAVVRYSYVDSDQRGIDLSDGVRSAPGSGTLDKLHEWFVGGNYYFHENDTKFQLGYIRAEAEDSLTGVPLKAKTEGVRSQVQIQF